MTDVRFIEAKITINNTALTLAQSMTIRVAIETLALSLSDDDSPIADGYRARIEEIRRLIFK